MKTFKVYYKMTPTFMCDEDLTVKKVSKKHVFLREMQAEHLEDCFIIQQGERWSPNGEAVNLILEKGLTHTSMSVGDVAYDVAEDKYYQVDGWGWKVVER